MRDNKTDLTGALVNPTTLYIAVESDGIYQSNISNSQQVGDNNITVPWVSLLTTNSQGINKDDFNNYITNYEADLRISLGAHVTGEDYTTIWVAVIPNKNAGQDQSSMTDSGKYLKEVYRIIPKQNTSLSVWTSIGAPYTKEDVGVEGINSFGNGNLYLSLYGDKNNPCLLYTSPSPRDAHESRMPSSA